MSRLLPLTLTLRIFILQEVKRMCTSSQLLKSTMVVLIPLPSYGTTVEIFIPAKVPATYKHFYLT